MANQVELKNPPEAEQIKGWFDHTRPKTAMKYAEKHTIFEVSSLIHRSF